MALRGSRGRRRPVGRRSRMGNRVKNLLLVPAPFARRSSAGGVLVVGLVTACAACTTSPSSGAHPAGPATTAPVDATFAHIFWAQSPRGREDEPGSIGRAHQDGTGANGHFILGARSPAGVALHGGYVYWSNYGSHTIARARVDGSHIDTELVEKAGFEPLGVAVDDQHIYWTHEGINPDSGVISRANLDGSITIRNFIYAGDAPTGLAVDPRHIYWTHRYWDRDYEVKGYAIGRANLDGSGVDPNFIDTSNKITGVAVNGRYIFWSNSAEGTIGRANLDGTNVDQQCFSPKNVPVGNVPEGLAADDEHVYWTNYPANTIGRADLDGTGLNDRFVAVKGVPEGIVVPASNNPPSHPNASADCVGPTEAPVLLGSPGFRAGYYATGWGEVAPPIVSNGGAAASGTISGIHWSNWGDRAATGRAHHPIYRPRGGYYARSVLIQLRASRIRRCEPGGPLVYTRFMAREPDRPGGPVGKWFPWVRDMCHGFPF